MLTKIFLCFVLLSTWHTANATVDVDDPNENLQVLYDLTDADLQFGLESVLNEKPLWGRLIRQKRMAVGLVDLSREKVRFARVNGDDMMYALLTRPSKMAVWLKQNRYMMILDK